MPPVLPPNLLVPILALVVLGALTLPLHLPQLVIQTHLVLWVFDARVLTFKQGLNESVKVRVCLEWRVGCLHLGKVGFVDRTIPFAQGRVDDMIAQSKRVDQRD